ncbi:hypothetical protein BH23GEM11_BH23GEM11_20490 [soil metagenome]
MTPAHRRLVGIIPCADHSGAIGGAPPPLLQTGDGSFLERAISHLRVAGVGLVLVGVRDRRDPVAARALRAGGTVVEVGAGEHDPGGSLRAAGERIRSGEDPQAAGSTDSVTGFLYLPATYPLIRAETMAELTRAWREAETIPGILAPVLPTDSPRAGVPWWELAPLFLRGPHPETRMTKGPGAEGPGHAQDAPLTRVEVVDPGVSERIDTLPLYRRHFPQAFRKRFQKW